MLRGCPSLGASSASDSCPDIQVKRILLVKTSSLGDVIHNLPVASDIGQQLPGTQLDWIVEAPYAPLVALHPAVHRVIPVALRRWRRELLRASTWKEIGAFRSEAGAERYDDIVDTQGLLKSGLIARAARGRHHGFDAASAREPLVATLYDARHTVAGGQHAVQRNRLLAGAALGYAPVDEVRYGISAPVSSITGRYAVLLHGTSREDKLWPESNWLELGRALGGQGVRCVLPWGSPEERERSERLASQLANAEVPPALPLDRLAGVLGGAQAVVGVDTGLTHLAVALERPVVAVYCGSDPALTGVYGHAAIRNLGAPGRPPEAASVVQALRDIGAW